MRGLASKIDGAQSLALNTKRSEVVKLNASFKSVPQIGAKLAGSHIEIWRPSVPPCWLLEAELEAAKRLL